MTGYEAFCLYNSLKLHFSNKDYDFFKYNGKSNISINSFENRKDKYYFYKISRKFPIREDYVDFLVSNFLHDEQIWIGNLILEEAAERNRERLRNVQSLSYIFKNDCTLLIENCSDPNSILEVQSGNYPKLLKMYLQHDVQLETVCIMNSLMNFITMWSRKISDTIQWPMIERRIKKYTPFLVYDSNKMKNILLEQMK